MKAKVSICIPAFNQPEKTANCLDSIKKQSFKNFEVIVTDDSSDDSIQNICQQFQSSFKLKYLKNKTPLGAPRNWNKTIKESSGEYIKFLFHDDRFTDKHSLKQFVNLLDAEREIDFAFSGSCAVDPAGVQIFLHTAKPSQIKKLRNCPETLFPANFIGTPSATIFRKKTNAKFDENLRWVVDLDLYYSILSRNNKFNFTAQPLVSVTVGDSDQLTSQCENNKQLEIYEWFYLFRKIRKSKKYNFQHFWFFWRLLNKYNIYSTAEIIKCGINFELPEIAHYIVSCRKKFRALLGYRSSQRPICLLCLAYKNILG